MMAMVFIQIVYHLRWRQPWKRTRLAKNREKTMARIRLLLVVLGVGLINACGGGGGGSGGNTQPFVPVPSNTASGTVMFKGTPLAGATVTVYETNSNRVFATLTTDANGNYSVGGLGTSCTMSCTINYQFFASKAGYAFNPFMATNVSGDRSAYLWDPSPKNWYVNTGAAVTRAGYNGAFSNPNGGSGIMFNVVNLNSGVNNSITGANFNAYDGSNPLVSIVSTGLSKRYTDNQDGTVTDNLTGLVWLRNAGCLSPALWANALSEANQLASGTCGLTDGSKAGDWRLPNLVELESLVDVSASNPALTAGNPFTAVSTGIYWTSTSYYGGQVGSPNAWAIRMQDGRYINDTASSNLNIKATSTNAVWAVKGTSSGAGRLQATGFYVFYASGDDGSLEKGVPLPAPRMRDNGNGTVTDTATGLVWLKKADCIQQNWAAALGAISTLASGQCGLTDGSVAGAWRMPTRKEMLSLADRAQGNMADYFDESFNSSAAGIASQPASFSNFAQFQYYWTSSANAASSGDAWSVFSCDFGVYNIPMANTGYALAVR
ncbi:DUF1566 domain-containing protein [Duganella sp. BJB476]|nr:DUF1566 domain-containing protein [Duganella sp. BJB476]